MFARFFRMFQDSGTLKKLPPKLVGKEIQEIPENIKKNPHLLEVFVRMQKNMEKNADKIKNSPTVPPDSLKKILEAQEKSCGLSKYYS